MLNKMNNTLKINPQVLKWAREEAGWPVERIADKLKIDRARYLHWETTGEEIPFSKLRMIAAWYKRQIAIFFLSEIPPKTKKPKDYRNLSLLGTPLSKETLLAFRRVRKYQDLLVACNRNVGGWLLRVFKHHWADSDPVSSWRYSGEI